MASLLGILLVIKNNVEPAKLLFWSVHNSEVEHNHHKRVSGTEETGGRRRDNNKGMRTRTSSPQTTGQPGGPQVMDLQSREISVSEHSVLPYASTTTNGNEPSASRYAISSNKSKSNRCDHCDHSTNLDLLIGGHTCIIGKKESWNADYEDVIADALIPEHRLCGQLLELKIDTHVFVGHPTIIEKESNDTTNFVFNVVVVLRSGVSRPALDHYHKLAERIATAIFHDELRYGFLTSQIKIISQQHDALHKTAKKKELEGKVDPNQLITRILQHSSLARNLRAISGALAVTGTMHVLVGERTSVSFKLHPDECFRLAESTMQHCSMDKLRPYHTILLNEPASSIFGRLPTDCSSSLYRLILACSPLKSLQDLALEIDISLPQVYRLTMHILAWGEASLTHTMSGNNIYCISPDFSLDGIHSNVVENFAHDFDQHSFWSVATKFSLPRPFSDHMKALALSSESSQKQYLLQVQWLLHRRVIVLLKTYVFLCVVNPRNDTYINKEPGNRREINDPMTAEVKQETQSFVSQQSPQLPNEVEQGTKSPSISTSEATVGFVVDRARLHSTRSAKSSSSGTSPIEPSTEAVFDFSPIRNSYHSETDIEPFSAEDASVPVVRQPLEQKEEATEPIQNENQEPASRGIPYTSTWITQYSTHPKGGQSIGTYFGLSDEEYRAIERIEATPTERNRFLRLCKYLRGNHVLEEIMYQENMSRDSLIAILKQFSLVVRLVTR